jgi:hypothetical protein
MARQGDEGKSSEQWLDEVTGGDFSVSSSSWFGTERARDGGG